jgi:uncharacterized MnhB-related membrane protein
MYYFESRSTIFYVTVLMGLMSLLLIFDKNLLDSFVAILMCSISYNMGKSHRIW